MMKYKELRMLYILGIMFIIAIGGSTYFMMLGNFSKGLIALIFSFIIVIMILTKYKMHVKDTYAIVYIYYGITVLPMVISFKDIRDVSLVSRHKLKIQYLKTATVYIVDAISFYKELQEKLQLYKETTNNKKANS
jgi:hypothetical protein